MPLFVTFAKYTPEGRENIDEIADRYRSFKGAVESKGGKVLSTYTLMGEWDILTVMDFPDEKSAMKVLVALGKTGRLTTQTQTALNVDDMIDLVRQG